MTTLISAENLVVGYDIPAIHPLSFALTKPGIYALVGPNGSGKSTFLKTLAGLLPPLSGSFEGVNDKTKTYVPQSDTVNKYFHIAVRSFILQGFGPNFKVSEKDRASLEGYLKEWQLLPYGDKCFHELSGGQKTRAMIVRALISEPQIIFLDEPLSSLDSCCQQQLMVTLADLVKTKKNCILIVDHHLEKFTPFVQGWFEFSKSHDDAVAFVKERKI